MSITTVGTGLAAVIFAAAGAVVLAENAMGDERQLSAGTAMVDITPPLGYRMSGYFHERLATGVSDPLHAKALVLKQGKERAAMVFCDIIGLSAEVSSQARKQAEAKTGIAAANILLAATHSHTGPLYSGALRRHFHDQAVAKHGSDPCEKEDYPRKLIAGIVEAIVKADASAVPVRLSAGRVPQKGLAFNRRFHMKDGTVRFNPGPLNGDIIRPAGPTDPNVGIVLIRDAAGDGGKVRAMLVNFAMHLDTVGGTLYSADYPGHLQKALQETLGEQLLVLFGTGTCGDINHIDVSRRDRPKADEIGRALAGTAADAVGALTLVDKPALAARREVVRLPLQKPTAEQVAWATEAIHKVGTQDLPFLKQVEAYKVVSLHYRGADAIDLEVQAFRLGPDLAVVGLPGEVFVELGLAIKRASPFATTLVVELCQDSPGYIPTKKAFEEGSYETVNSRVAPGGGEKLVEAAGRLLKDLGPRD